MLSGIFVQNGWDRTRVGDRSPDWCDSQVLYVYAFYPHTVRNVLYACLLISFISTH